MPTLRELLIATLAVLLALSVTNLIRPAQAGAPGPTTDVVFVATGENFPDALAAAAAAGALLSPVLLVQQNSVPAETAAELNRLTPDLIIIVGGTAVISDGVKSTLEGIAPLVVRIAGVNRYATAAALSQLIYPTHGLYPVAAYAGADDLDVIVFDTDVVVMSVTLTAPVEGTVIVNSIVSVSEGTPGDSVSCSITTGSVVDPNALQTWESPGADGSWGQLAATRGFDVVTGQELTANLVCVHSGSSPEASVFDPAMTAIFVADI